MFHGSSWFPCFQDSGVYAAVLRANVFPADLLSGTSSWFLLNAHTVTPTAEITVLRWTRSMPVPSPFHSRYLWIICLEVTMIHLVMPITKDRG